MSGKAQTAVIIELPTAEPAHQCPACKTNGHKNIVREMRAGSGTGLTHFECERCQTVYGELPK